MIDGSTKTEGEFFDEPEAWRFFDSLLALCRDFKVYREVSGEYIQPRPDSGSNGARIDRILIPTGQTAIDWGCGAIGVEGKKSGYKSGPLITQAMDYTRCVFRLEGACPGLLIIPTWIFIYPLDKLFGDIESVTVNNRIGTVSAEPYCLKFITGGTNAITIDGNGVATAKRPPMGWKRGSR